VLERRGVPALPPRYYPTDSEYRARLEAHGFTVWQIALIPRPTLLPTGMRGWLETFERSTFDRLSEPARASTLDEIEELLRPSLTDLHGQWTADYVRLRFSAANRSAYDRGAWIRPASLLFCAPPDSVEAAREFISARECDQVSSGDSRFRERRRELYQARPRRCRYALLLTTSSPARTLPTRTSTYATAGADRRPR
jgi:hypothetical protein